MKRSDANTVKRRDVLRAAVVANMVALPSVSAQEPVRKRIYIAADDHTDYMWTGDEAEYRQAFLQTLDHYLDLADATDREPSDYQSRWNCDGLLWFREFQQNRDASQVARLVRRIKSGHISVPMTMLVSCYGAAPTEAVLRGLYYGGHVERKYGLRLRVAVSMENQTLPYGLGMLWAGSGVRYSWKGICGCASKLPSAGNREHDVYWWVGPDESRILMKWYSLGPKLRAGLHANEGPGGYAEARDPRLAIEYADADPDFRKRNPHSVIGLFGQGWDDLATRVPLADARRSFPVVAKDTTSATRRVIVSNEFDYFADMEQTHGGELPEVRTAFGNEWELYSASLVEVSASVKRATEKLRAAEAMASVVTLHRPGFSEDLTEMRDQAWIAYGLYWEHDWTADGPISRDRRAAWQRKIAKQITDYVNTLHDRAAKQLGELIAGDSSELFVFNSLGWQRTDVVDLDAVEYGVRDHQPIEIVDVESGNVVPTQMITRDDRRLVRFLAADVPACGYRLFQLRDRTVDQPQPTVACDNDRGIESKRYKFQVRPNGAFDSWYSKTLERFLVNDDQTANEIETSRGVVTVESAGSVSTTVRVDVRRPLARTTRYTFYEASDRVDVENVITENFANVRSWRFDFGFDQPRTYHEEVGAILDAAYSADGGHYADRNSRTDWLTLNHFVAMHDDAVVVTLSSNDCQFFHLGEKLDQQLDGRSSTVHVLAGGQIDGPKLGIPKQGGDQHFLQRFSLRCDPFAGDESRGQSMRFSLECQNPLVVGNISGGPARGSLPAHPFSLLSLQSDGVMLWAVKPSEGPSEEGPGLTVRLWNLAAKPSRYSLSINTPEGLQSCVITSHVETPEDVAVAIAEGSFVEQIPASSIRTLRCQ